MEEILGNIHDLNENPDHDDIKSKLSAMSFEDLQRLKAELGTKLFKEARFGGKDVQKNFKRLNKNRPREASSKLKPQMVMPKTRTVAFRDPRFDSMCGTFDRKIFEKNYEFLNKIKSNEIVELKKMLKTETNPIKLKNIRYLIQRIENQERERLSRQKQEAKQKGEREEQIRALKQGRRPVFKSKFEKKVGKIIEKYEELKESGKLEKYIEKKLKKNNQKYKRNFE